MEEGLLDELVIPSGAARRRSTLVVQAIRELTDDDLGELLDPTMTTPAVIGIQQVRHIHHQIAMLLAKGASHIEISNNTGYSPSYISTLQNMPMVKELVEHYAQQRAMAFVDVAERMKTLGIMAIEELQQRLSEDPAGWTRRELMELSKQMAGDAGGARGQSGQTGAGNGPAVALTIQFVKPQADEAMPVVTLDGQSREI